MSSWFPQPSRPLPVEDGIKARSQRGAIAQTWWSERFIAVMEAIVVGGRLERGRTYARKGQVIALDVGPGAVTASVQGSRRQPYRVRVGITAFGKAEWARVSEVLAGNAWYAARLLAGDMPDDIEDAFASVGLTLFPARAADLSMDCSCPDWEVPCKHLAAVFYLLAEAFDEDPFLILAWRGRDRTELLSTLSALRTGTVAVDSAAVGDSAVPLADRLDTFFSLQSEIPPRTSIPVPVDTLLDQLPPIPAKVRNRPLAEVLRPIYLRLGAETVDESDG